MTQERLHDHKLALKNARRDHESLMEEVKKEKTRLAKEHAALAKHTEQNYTDEESEQLFDELMDATQETKELREEIKALTKRMTQASRENERLSKELSAYKKEVPEMKGRFEIESKTLRTELTESLAALETTKSKLARLKGEIPTVKEKLAQGESMQQELQSAKKTITDQRTVQTQLQEDVERFKTNAQTHATNVKACTHMLSNTDQVLRACVELHSAQQNKESPLSKALAESSAKVSEFLQRLEEEAPGKKKIP